MRRILMLMSWNATASCPPTAIRRQYTVLGCDTAISTSGSSPAVAEKRTFKVLSVRTLDEEACAARGLSRSQLDATLLHCVVAVE
jgi:hypothetical protein